MYHLEHVGRRVPDAAWISRTRLQRVPPRRRLTILPVPPEFVVEIRSQTDALDDLMEKMRQWLSDGVVLGLLLEPQTHTAYVFSPGKSEPDVLSDVFADQPLLPGFVLDLRALWAAYDDALREQPSSSAD